ncbi:MAG: MmcQ/YjbR family DNA-binding protein [Myxococcota bacterium]
MTFAELRAFAASLPGTTEAPHFELLSFRVGTKIYATVPPGAPEVRVFVDEAAAREAVAREPGALELLYWGAKLAGVRARLDAADDDHLRALLRAAWERKGAKRARR